MHDETDDLPGIPLIALPARVYDAVLLADAAMIVAKGGVLPGGAGRASPALPDFFAVRRCLLTPAARDRPVNRAVLAETALLRSMVGG
jgi:hypothetical protein